MKVTWKDHAKAAATWAGIFLVAFGIALGLYACAISPEAERENYYQVPDEEDAIKYTVDHQIELKDGRTVTCLFYDPPSRSNGALDCDWANAK